MSGQERSQGWAWVGIGPPTGEPGPANQNEFFLTKGLYYRQKYPAVSSAVRVAGLRQSRRWSSRMWRSWAGVVTRGLRLWGWLGILPNSLKLCWRRLMVEKWTLNYLATALLGIPTISMPIARSLNLRTAHFRVAFCPQHKVHLCNDHAI